MKKAVVTGAGGFIGYHLVSRLKDEGYWVCGIDLKHPPFGYTSADQFLVRDLRDARSFDDGILGGVDEVYALAADMGGMGFISANHAAILYNNLAINLNTLQAARAAGVGSYFFSSSVCVYPGEFQDDWNFAEMAEAAAFPASPPDAYGWEKLTTEELCRHYRHDYGLNTHVARFNNTYGPYGAWRGGREKAPAALCRKVAIAKLSGQHEVEIWGDGEQVRPFIYVDDTIEAIRRLVESGHPGPMNFGTDETVTINELAYLIAGIAGISITLRHVDGPEGVRNRLIRNNLMRQTFDWQPSVSLRDGLRRTYAWIERQVLSQGDEGGAAWAA